MNFRIALILTLFLIATPISHAQIAANYRFEVIIFEYTNPQYTETESWAKDPGQPDYTNALFTIKGNATNQSTPVIRSRKDPSITFQPLKAGSLILKKEAKAVSRSSLRKKILHTGWIQSMHPTEKAYPVAIKVGKQFTSLVADTSTNNISFTNDSSDSENVSSFAGSTMSYENQAAMIPVKLRQLEGTIKITIGRYLHVWTDLVYRRALSNSAMLNNNQGYTELQTFRHRDHRKMRSKELHYIDNPSFGILVYALPIKPASTSD